MARPAQLFYSEEHEWLRLDGDVATVGITDYAQESLGDIVYVELPKVGTKIEQFGEAGVVESVKAVSDIFSPMGGEVTEVNDAIERDPALVNREPFGGGWLFKLRVDDPSQKDNLLSAQDYDEFVQGQ
jgi:glycine cleavage system H protein